MGNASSADVMLCDLEMLSTSTAMNSRGQDHLLTLDKSQLG